MMKVWKPIGKDFIDIDETPLCELIDNPDAVILDKDIREILASWLWELDAYESIDGSSKKEDREKLKNFLEGLKN